MLILTNINILDIVLDFMQAEVFDLQIAVGLVKI